MKRGHRRARGEHTLAQRSTIAHPDGVDLQLDASPSPAVAGTTGGSTEDNHSLALPTASPAVAGITGGGGTLPALTCGLPFWSRPSAVRMR